jgi:hypothetical protein
MKDFKISVEKLSVIILYWRLKSPETIKRFLAAIDGRTRSLIFLKILSQYISEGVALRFDSGLIAGIHSEWVSEMATRFMVTFADHQAREIKNATANDEFWAALEDAGTEIPPGNNDNWGKLKE